MIAQVVASERAVAQTKYVAMHIWGCRTAIFELKKNWNILEKVIIEGDNPVYETLTKPSRLLSSAGHEKSCMNSPGPSGKAKYSPETDSEPVP